MKNHYDTVIIGSGLSGLAAAHFLKKEQADHQFIILEKSPRAGGAVRSFQEAGFLGEWGPHGFLDNTPESRELLQDIGLDREAQRAPLANFVRFVCHQGRLQQLPQSPGQLFSTPLLTLGGKLRLLAELWRQVRQEDQTIGQWAAHRFGAGVLPLIDAAVTGTFAGDYNFLSIDAVMPGVRQLEKNHGSLLRGLFHKRKEKKTGKTKGALPSMLSFPSGMEHLVQTLARDKPIRFNCPVSRITREGRAWTIESAEGLLSANRLITALPVNLTLQLLRPLSPPPTEMIPVAKIINIIMGFSESAGIPRGFGYLAPEKEKRFLLGAMFSTHMFPGRAPAGSVMLEALVGGSRHPERLELSDEELIKNAYADLSQLINLPEPPWFTKVLRPSDGIPQLGMDHPALLAWKRRLEQEHELIICGFGWEGIGMNEMIKTAKKAALIMAGGGNEHSEKKEVKPVYF